jgi:hypothetical protein
MNHRSGSQIKVIINILIVMFEGKSAEKEMILMTIMENRSKYIYKNPKENDS